MKKLQGALLMALCGAMAIVIALLHFGKMPYSWAIDPNAQQCLPDLHLALLVKSSSTTPVKGDLVFWMPAGSLGDIQQDYVLKQVAGTAGDRLTIRGDSVLINGSPVVSGFPLSGLYKRSPKDFERNEIIPAGQVFMIGTHPLSNDSRYWGYLSTSAIKGTGYKLF